MKEGDICQFVIGTYLVVCSCWRLISDGTIKYANRLYRNNEEIHYKADGKKITSYKKAYEFIYRYNESWELERSKKDGTL